MKREEFVSGKGKKKSVHPIRLSETFFFGVFNLLVFWKERRSGNGCFEGGYCFHSFSWNVVAFLIGVVEVEEGSLVFEQRRNFLFLILLRGMGYVSLKPSFP